MAQTSVAVVVNSQNVSAFPQKVNDSSGVLAGRVVVAGTNADEVKRPAGANASKIVGIAAYDAANGEEVSVHNFGIFNLVAASAVAVGDDINIANAEGQVKTVSEASTTVVYLVGIARSAAASAGQYVKVELRLGRATL